MNAFEDRRHARRAAWLLAASYLSEATSQAVDLDFDSPRDQELIADEIEEVIQIIERRLKASRHQGRVVDCARATDRRRAT